MNNYAPDLEVVFWASSIAFSKNRFLSDTVLGVLADGGGDCRSGGNEKESWLRTGIQYLF